MSDSGERTEDATPSRRQDARKKGQVAKSTDLVAAASLAVAGGALYFVAAEIPAGIIDLARTFWSGAPLAGRDIDAGATLPSSLLSPGAALREALWTALGAASPLVLVCAAAGLAATLLQTGPLLAPASVKPDIKRLDPVSGAKKLVSPSRLMVVARAAIALSLAVLVVYSGCASRAADILSLPAGDPLSLAALLASLLPTLIATSGLLLIVPGLIDLIMAHRRLAKELRMTRQQVRDEHKREEGDPSHKGRRRQAHRELSESAAPPLGGAKAVVVNPTHVAVALHHGADLPVPVVGARGRGEHATRIRSEARALGIPIVRDVTLARALVALDPGSSVPEPLFAAVAAVLAAVYRAELSRQGHGRSPRP